MRGYLKIAIETLIIPDEAQSRIGSGFFFFCTKSLELSDITIAHCEVCCAAATKRSAARRPARAPLCREGRAQGLPSLESGLDLLARLLVSGAPPPGRMPPCTSNPCRT